MLDAFKNRISDGESYRGPNALTSDPMYNAEIVADSSGFILQSGSPAFGSEMLINNSEISYPYDYFHNNGGKDNYDNTLSSAVKPNIGAYNGEGDEVNAFEGYKLQLSFNIYPNPVQANQSLIIEIPSYVNVPNLTIQVVDITGKTWSEQSFQQQHKIRLDTNDLTRGNYLIKLKVGDSFKAKQLLVF